VLDPRYDIVGLAEAAEILGVTTTRVHQLAWRDDFPQPVVVLVSGRIWERQAIEQWAHAHGRQPRALAAATEAS
jgi:predicted DNA-binding transcriptional regulator AlpA